jgi:hypothetical protein
MQRSEHQTEFANNKVDKRSDADEQQPRGTSELHGPNRLKLSDLAPDHKADQRLDSCELCGTAAATAGDLILRRQVPDFFSRQEFFAIREDILERIARLRGQ